MLAEVAAMELGHAKTRSWKLGRMILSHSSGIAIGWIGTLPEPSRFALGDRVEGLAAVNSQIHPQYRLTASAQAGAGPMQAASLSTAHGTAVAEQA